MHYATVVKVVQRKSCSELLILSSGYLQSGGKQLGKAVRGKGKWRGVAVRKERERPYTFSKRSDHVFLW
jgi:hypothetical protein